jgi:hypothetical protein
MNLKQIEINGGRITGDLPWRLEIPATQSGYTDAQIDDYHSLKRRNYIWQPGTHLSVRARFSVDTNKLRGTAGFGFWNAPFGDPTIPLPAFPRAVWFFFASEPSDLPLSKHGHGRGWFAATICVSGRKGISLLPFAPMILLLNQFRIVRNHLWPKIRQYLGISFIPIRCSLNQWHRYELKWHRESCEFRVDEQLIGQTDFSPQGPLGFVCWIDNQYMVARPTGRVRMGNLSLFEPQWMEVDALKIESLLEVGSQQASSI